MEGITAYFLKKEGQSFKSAGSIRKDMNGIALATIAGLSAAVCVLGTLRARRTAREAAERRRRLAEDTSTYCSEDYHADGDCGLCFDPIGGEEVAVCTCGKVYHRTCAEPTGGCPYCGAPFSEFGIREPRSITCPRCGSVTTAGICDCGAVMPDSRGRFPCPCGEELRITADRCPSCGRTFEKKVVAADKRFIPR